MQSVQPMHVASSMRAMTGDVVPSGMLGMALFYRRPRAVRLLHSKTAPLFAHLAVCPHARLRGTACRRQPARPACGEGARSLRLADGGRQAGAGAGGDNFLPPKLELGFR